MAVQDASLKNDDISVDSAVKELVEKSGFKLGNPRQPNLITFQIPQEGNNVYGAVIVAKDNSQLEYSRARNVVDELRRKEDPLDERDIRLYAPMILLDTTTGNFFRNSTDLMVREYNKATGNDPKGFPDRSSTVTLTPIERLALELSGTGKTITYFEPSVVDENNSPFHSFRRRGDKSVEIPRVYSRASKLVTSLHDDGSALPSFRVIDSSSPNGSLRKRLYIGTSGVFE